jgi:hypothetical protein
MTPAIITGFALLVFAWAIGQGKYKPAWLRNAGWWQISVGLVAAVAALLIVVNPEFYILGILGDSMFFDLLVLAISTQLHGILSHFGISIVVALKKSFQLANARLDYDIRLMALTGYFMFSATRAFVHRISFERAKNRS